MTRPAACLFVLVWGGPVLAQAEAPKLPAGQTFALTLRPARPPVPTFRYELIPSARDQVANNAALLLHRALHLLAEAAPSAKEFGQAQERFQKALDGSLRDFPKDEARAFLRPFANVFKEMEAAARCDHCDWGIDQRLAAEGIQLLIHDAQKLRTLAFLLRLRCRLHAADGKVEPALRDVQTGLVLGRHAGQSPTLIHYLIGIAIATGFITELEQTLQVPDCPNLYWSLTAVPRPFLDLRRAMEGELRSLEATIPVPKDVDRGPMTEDQARAALDRLWEGMLKLGGGSDRPGLAESRLGLAFYITMQHPSARKSLLAAGKTEAELDAMPPAQVVMLDSLVRFRDLRDQHFVWFTLPYVEALQGMRQSEEHLKELRRRSTLDLLPTMLGLLLPAVDRVYAAQVRTERRLASLRAVEAVRLHAAKTGKLPARLDDITEVVVPLDPITQKPFEYTTEGNTYTIHVPAPSGTPADRGNQWKYVITLGS